MSDKQPLHVRQAEGLRAFADFIEANPEFAEELSYSLRHIDEPVVCDDPVVLLGRFARAAARARVANQKGGSDKYFKLELRFSDAVVLCLAASRAEVCERVVVGTETVTKTVPDPAKLAEVPEIEVTETVETVEWVCRPLLAADAGGAS